MLSIAMQNGILSNKTSQLEGTINGTALFEHFTIISVNFLEPVTRSRNRIMSFVLIRFDFAFLILFLYARVDSLPECGEFYKYNVNKSHDISEDQAQLAGLTEMLLFSALYGNHNEQIQDVIKLMVNQPLEPKRKILERSARTHSFVVNRKFGLFELKIHQMVSLNILFKPDRIKSHGYPAETHSITTDDGYILQLFRIPHGRNASSAGKQPVFLMHGFLDSSSAWIALGPENSLGKSH